MDTDMAPQEYAGGLATGKSKKEETQDEHRTSNFQRPTLNGGDKAERFSGRKMK
jgi:hypothetical protein